MRCAYHPDNEPVGACVACGRLICVECKALLGGKIYCTPCADKIFVQNKPETTRVDEVEPITPQQQKVEAQTEVLANRSEEPGTQKSSNTSGQGSKAVLPSELKKWNWGAFFLTWIWGIGNSVWIAFLSFILGIIWAIVLGIKGNEWAWQHKKWNSIEHFQKTQKTWAKWGIGLFIVWIIIAIIAAVVSLLAAGWAIEFS
jgi:DNA-directed RNA polymerase subunit RPC12/RpoP